MRTDAFGNSKTNLLFVSHRDLFQSKKMLTLKGWFLYFWDLQTEIGKKRLRKCTVCQKKAIRLPPSVPILYLSKSTPPNDESAYCCRIIWLYSIQYVCSSTIIYTGL